MLHLCHWDLGNTWTSGNWFVSKESGQLFQTFLFHCCKWTTSGSCHVTPAGQIPPRCIKRTVQLSGVCAQPGNVGLFPSEILLQKFLLLPQAQVGQHLGVTTSRAVKKSLSGQETHGELLTLSLWNVKLWPQTTKKLWSTFTALWAPCSPRVPWDPSLNTCPGAAPNCLWCHKPEPLRLCLLSLERPSRKKIINFLCCFTPQSSVLKSLLVS